MFQPSLACAMLLQTSMKNSPASKLKKATLTNQLNDAVSEIDALKSERSDLQNSISALNMDLTQTKSQLKNQDTSIKKQWFFNGAMVLGVGLLLGLIIPRLFSRRKTSMENWG